MNRKFRYNIHESEATLTVEAFLRSKGYSHRILAHLKRTPEGIVLNGVWARVTENLSEGDVLDITLTDPAQQSPAGTSGGSDSGVWQGALPRSR